MPATPLPHRSQLGHPEPGAARRGRKAIFDPRFAIGIALVALSVLGVVGVVSASDASVEVFAARDTLTPGQRVTAGDLTTARIGVGSQQKLYLGSGGMPQAGLVVTRTIAAGELVPRSAVGNASGVDLTSIVIAPASAIPDSVQPGDRVDLWAARRSDDSATFGAPTVLVSSAIVVRLVEQKGIVAPTTGASIDILVPRSDVAAVLEATANSAAVSVVPVDLPLAG